MEIINLYPGSFGSNCYCLFSGSDAALADPSANAKDILACLSEHRATLRLILLTHGHFDHMLALDDLRTAMPVPVVCLHEKDADMPGDAARNAFRLFFGTDRTWLPPTQCLSGGETLWLGEEKIEVIHTPGHTAGSVSYLCADTFLLTGDTLFDGNVGRCDLPGGDATALLHSLQKLRTLSPDLTIYPGHGGSARLKEALDRVLPNH